jgi:hypothetical protein
VKDVREEVARMGYERKAYFTRLRPKQVCKRKSLHTSEQTAERRKEERQRQVAVHFTGVMEPQWTRKLNIEIRKLRQIGGTMENYK